MAANCATSIAISSICKSEYRRIRICNVYQDTSQLEPIKIHMTLYDFSFWFFGPTSIWFLGTAVMLSAIVTLVNTSKNTSELKKTNLELRRGASELERITSELRKDTAELRNGLREETSALRGDISELTNGTSELNRELRVTCASIDKYHKTLQQMYSFCFPFWK